MVLCFSQRSVTCRQGVHYSSTLTPRFLRHRYQRCRPCAANESASGDGGPNPQRPDDDKPLARLAKACNKASDEVLKVLTPKQEGDLMDWVLMWSSVMVFVWMAAQLYRIYAYLYYAAGLRTIADMMGGG